MNGYKFFAAGIIIIIAEIARKVFGIKLDESVITLCVAGLILLLRTWTTGPINEKLKPIARIIGTISIIVAVVIQALPNSFQISSIAEKADQLINSQELNEQVNEHVEITEETHE